MNSFDIRKKFFTFFTHNDHTQVSSSSLIPAQDATLLFANAGMNQFKDIFLGLEKRSYRRAVTIQKCVRAGGKHNDLDNVGFTKRHLTFFEMMGNFSFGDYFKKEAITFAWNFLTKELQLPIEKLHVSVHHTDQDSYDIWHQHIGIPTARIHRLGDADNFWQMGETGPCGPCSEIYIDRGPSYGSGTLGEESASERFLEIWNLVFMQFDKQPDGYNKPLVQTGVDTGMGLERLCAVLQNKESVFEIDLFQPLIAYIDQYTGLRYAEQDFQTKAAFHVLIDHIRSASFIIADGGTPSNEGRGYVLRKIIRRAALFAQKLTQNNALFPLLSRTLIEYMHTIYPELLHQQELIFNILESEIEKFSHNLVRGKQLLEDYFQKQHDTRIVSGAQAFKLYDTFGFPIELIHIMAAQHTFSVDTTSFEQLMLQQKEQSGKKVADPLAHIDLSCATEFTGYHELETTGTIIALIAHDQSVSQVKAGEACYVITDRSPFFIVGGGQVPDQGWLQCGETQVPLQEVRYIGPAIAARIIAPITLLVGDSITSIVDKQRRTDAMKNHTATHLLQAALIAHFGKQIKQSGSLVAPDYLRFDFTYHANLNEDDIQAIERIVNEKIRDNIDVEIIYTSLKQALEQGVLAFFGEKYKPEQVRIVKIADFSAELCGGTHVHATGGIGIFKIVEVQALAAGLRRIVAVTGPAALQLFQEQSHIIKKINQHFKITTDHIVESIEKQQAQLKHAQHELKIARRELWNCKVPAWLAHTVLVEQLPLLYLEIPSLNSSEIKEVTQLLIQKQEGLVFIMSRNADKIGIFATISHACASLLDLKDLRAWLSTAYSINSGGSATQMQGGTTQMPALFKDALLCWLSENLKK